MAVLSLNSTQERALRISLAHSLRTLELDPTIEKHMGRMLKLLSNLQEKRDINREANEALRLAKTSDGQTPGAASNKKEQ